ncbi:M3 family metallopeptidase [Shewanella sp. 1_MG-2023]|uniref:M3 family metallopeptidase n=1 Tax=unclassified Shewanella TaxID=196818 RepID=UPI001E3B3EB5|nr:MULTISPECIES: M3 family metallopeptidase [unclassified Shewanella]MCC4832384.1 M3 family metallopeptidase [Shewanella sp. 10N.7]MDO6610841.1 M3 family metallopeptidase [Shewanella sp. 7_MG-2023]MDO6770308.1 M3 family metallopeptidase [Shewanella sp. 2_MG-2023]MDO6793449.1 M3 family metallopeptidase [Shewanella sp. 1_MG-2023]
MKGLTLKPLVSAMALTLMLSACANDNAQTTTTTQAPNVIANNIIEQNANNPFFKPYGTFMEIPDFDKIKDEHYLPGFKAGIAAQQAEIAAIVANPEAPTFENTIEAMEFSGALLTKVASVFYNLTGAHTNPAIQEISKQVSPMLSSARDDISLNDDLFKRVKAVYLQKDALNLNTAKAKLLEDTYKRFTRGGANLSAEDKDTLRALNEQIGKLNLEFGDNLLAETNAFELVIDNEAGLAGLPQDVIDTAAATATKRGHDGKWVFTTQRPSITPFLTYAENRDLREAIFKGYIERANNDNANDNKKGLAKIAALRAEKAALMGYKTHAHFVLEERTAKTPENVYGLLDKVWPAALAQANAEVKDMQALIDSQGGDFKLEAWDWWYYSDQIRVAKYSFNEQQTRPYFSLEATLDGVFYTANRLFGITVKERTDLPKYHPDVRTWEVYDKDGSFLAVFMGDYYVRDSKRGGAWMNSYRKQYNMNGIDSKPIIVNVLNYPQPTGDEPSLLTFDEASTLFHEFGHALHGILSDVEYASQAGTAVPRDYVEFPSQVMENWMTQPEVLAQFAKHYKTGEVIPQELVEKIQAASKFNQGFATVEYMAATKLDLDWHTLNDNTVHDAAKFEAESLANMGLIKEIAPRYRSTYFSHIFAGGYSAGYYSYLWSDILGADAFEAFKENGIFDPATAQAFRDNILSQGGSADPMDLYRQFRGKDAGIEPLLRSRGLLEDK